MIKARIRWCSCRVENILTLGKLLVCGSVSSSILFCFLYLKTSYRTYKIISSYELAPPIMGTIFLVIHGLCVCVCVWCVNIAIIVCLLLVCTDVCV